MVILLMTINNYLLVAIIWMVIDGYFVNGYWWILLFFNVIILMAIGGYYINGYWWLLY